MTSELLECPRKRVTGRNTQNPGHRQSAGDLRRASLLIAGFRQHGTAHLRVREFPPIARDLMISRLKAARITDAGSFIGI